MFAKPFSLGIRVVCFICVTVSLLATSVSADGVAPKGEVYTAYMPNERPAPGVGDGITPMVGGAANNCGSLLDLGVLPFPGAYGVAGDTTGGGNDFEYGGSACGDMGSGGQDEIWMFQVGAVGYWSFGTCYDGYSYAAFDTSLQITQEDGSCPGFEVACNGDGAGCPDWSSLIEEVFLTTGTTYYAIVDGWSTDTYGTYTLIFELVREECDEDADCSNGIACDGYETCNIDTGECFEGTPPCADYQRCEEPDGTCVDPDPCLTYLTGEGEGFVPQSIYGGEPGMHFADEVELETHGGTRELISYSLTYASYTHWFWDPVGMPYHVNTALGWTEFVSCTPWMPIPGTECGFDLAVKDTGAEPDQIVCEPNGGLPTGLILPDNSGIEDYCEIDFWMVANCDIMGAGFRGTNEAKLIGETGFEDEIGQTIIVRQALDEFGELTNTWIGLGWGTPDDFGDAFVCTVPAGGCCYDAGGCDVMTEAECVAAGGTYLGDNSMADPIGCADEDPDGDGLYGACDNCAVVINFDQLDCNDDGEGDACEPVDEQDGDGDGVCNGVDGCPDDPAKAGPGQCGCGNPDTDSDIDGIADCIDECPLNPLWQLEPTCGCDSSVYDNWDSDGDNVANCFDTCSGVDDAEFGPCDDAIPTVSEWGIVVMTLLMLIGGKIAFTRRRLQWA